MNNTEAENHMEPGRYRSQIVMPGTDLAPWILKRKQSYQERARTVPVSSTEA